MPNPKINELECQVKGRGLEKIGIPENSKMSKIKPIGGNNQS